MPGRILPGSELKGTLRMPSSHMMNPLDASSLPFPRGKATREQKMLEARNLPGVSYH